MISFRLTAEEYDTFRELCFTQGIRSVSEMARAAMHLLVQQPARVPKEALESRVAELEGRVHVLALEIKKLNHAAISKAARAPESSFPEPQLTK
jgi:N-methylhydantoinase A/oxoprolinase/acetone carboxylase beta subunit